MHLLRTLGIKLKRKAKDSPVPSPCTHAGLGMRLYQSQYSLRLCISISVINMEPLKFIPEEMQLVRHSTSLTDYRKIFSSTSTCLQITSQCLQAACLSFSINIPIFQYFTCIFSIFTKGSIYDVFTKFFQFSVFLKFYQYLSSEFSKNTDKSVYLEALISRPAPCD